MRTPRPGIPTRAVGYVRVSTDRQDLGPEAQRAHITAWAERSGVAVVSWCEDRSSGALEMADRPGLVEALALVTTHRAGVLVVARRDRLARDVGIAIAIERATARAGARVVSADGVANGSEPSEAFIRTMLDAAASYERELIRARTRSALAVKKKRGERVSRWAPYGWAFDPTGKRLVPHPREHQVVALVRSLRADGFSFRAILEVLAEHQVTSRSGRPFHLRTLQRLLARPA